MEADEKFTVDTEFLLTGRTLCEYRAMFDLEIETLADRTVLDCPSGAGSFVREAADRGAEITGVDMLYDQPPAVLKRRVQDDFGAVANQLPEKADLFEWNFYGTVAHRLELMERAIETFLSDYPTGRTEGRYVYGQLPTLPFADETFSLVLSAHLLFLYGDRLDFEFHLTAIRELCRVASEEVRIFPLVGLDTEPYDRLDAVIEILAEDGYQPARIDVPFEFQQGATELLRIGV
ncbi:class I SAM-dependent methyltransferase [Halocatena halophila]|uniref:class I SAM-dependent methyltransferase n=1 Tax=Halocatena halophila TaxID=2814576 RepID=UPI002ED5E910